MAAAREPSFTSAKPVVAAAGGSKACSHFGQPLKTVPTASSDETQRALWERVGGASPFLLPLAGLQWSAYRQWATPSGAVDLNSFEADLGQCKAPVAVQATGGASYSGEQRHTERVDSFVHRLRALDSQNHEDTANAEKAYLRDFHFAQEAPEVAEAVYSTPLCFREDVLNWWWAGGARKTFESLRLEPPYAQLSTHQLECLEALIPAEDDFRFLYLGMAGSGTALHHDVIRSHSWSGQIAGHKLWILFPPSCTRNLLHPVTGECLVDDVWEAAPAAVLQHARALAAATKDIRDCELPHGISRTQECIQNSDVIPDSTWAHAYATVQPPGTAIFVPSGWYHQVHNLSRSLSINHNWFDSSALPKVCAFVVEEAVEVRERIADCRSPDVELEADVPFAILCERVMRADIRCNIAQFCLLLSLLSHVCGQASQHSCTTGLELHDRRAMQLAIDACSDQLAQEPLVRMATKATTDEQLDLQMCENGLCIVTMF